ncbi:polyketide synthase [Pyrenophora seminiperda CCB06]|uniref:Polyketide synthase n=1 Tax=Pyrenophora seminiperda CCB06 TaxID=1302712 RepID=A0A3M7LVK4_9PLEO|nr:polyketide synthase [Pyrenophora seminiperda CCB06]
MSDTYEGRDGQKKHPVQPSSPYQSAPDSTPSRPRHRIRLRDTKAFLAPPNRRLFASHSTTTTTITSSPPQGQTNASSSSAPTTPGMQHWKTQLLDGPPPTPVFPFASCGFRNPDDDDAPPSFHCYELPVSATLSLNVRFLCRAKKYEHIHVGLAALQVLLAQLMGTDDFVIGLGRVVGVQRDIMPVRFKGDLEYTSSQLLEQTVKTMQEAKMYLHEPVKVLLAELGLPRQTLLHRVTFDWLSGSQAATGGGGGGLDVYFEQAQDLVVLVREDDERNLVVVVALDQTSYDEEFAKVVAELYVRAMEQVAADGDVSIVEMDLFSKEDRDLNMARGTGPVVESTFTTILHRLHDVCLKMPDHIAAKEVHGCELTYAQLVQRAVAMSSKLKSHGVVVGTAVCVFGPPTVDLLCSIIAIWCAGGIHVPLDHRISLEENFSIARHCEMEFCVVSRPELTQYAHVLGFVHAFYCADMSLNKNLGIDECSASDLAVGLHAPTSDGTSKAVLLSHGNLATLISSVGCYFDEENLVVLQHSRWTSDLALFQILFALTSGGTLVLASELGDADIVKVMAKEKVGVTVATPSEYSAWFRKSRNILESCSAWKFAFNSRENLSSSVVRNFAALGNSNLELVNMYGATETSITCCMGFVDYKEYAADVQGKLIPVGHALPNYQIWIADPLGRALPPGWTGDIWVTGPGAIGSYPSFEVDSCKIQVHPDTGESCFWTSDWGFLNDQGVLFVVSRHSDESAALIRGHYVELGDIARAIVDKSMGRVAEAVVVLSKENEQDELHDGSHVHAFVTLSEATNTELLRHLQSVFQSLQLPTYMRPSCAVILKTMPRTVVGRIDRHALENIAAAEPEVVRVVQVTTLVPYTYTQVDCNTHPDRSMLP